MIKRLDELVNDYFLTEPDLSRFAVENLSKFLADNGVFALPCKVGTPVYFLCEIKMFKGSDGGFTTDYGINIRRLSDICISGFRIVYKAGLERFFEEDIGRTVFFTLEDAEKALAEREDKR